MNQKKLLFILCSLFMFLAIGNSLFAQKRIISGNVCDTQQQPLIGVAIFITETPGIGVVTDADGNYRIEIPAGAQRLTFSYTGMEKQIINIENKDIINVILKEENQKLDAVVVTALNVKREEKSLGFAYSQLNNEDISTNKTLNVQSALIGKVAGLDMTESANGLAGSKRTQIRGISSISVNSDNGPLWVIDGIPVNSANFGRNKDAGGGIDYGDGLSSFNPDDIANISVLKGNAAAALYGSRASNGVIIITTKNGSSAPQGTTIEWNSTMTLTAPVDLSDYQYVYGQGTYAKRPIDQQDALVSGASSWGEKLDGEPTPQFDGESRPYSAAKNNFHKFYANAFLYSNTLSINKNAETYNFRLSVGQTDSKDIIHSGKYQRRNAQINAQTKFGKFTANVISNYVIENVKNRQFIGGNVHNASYTLTSLPTSLDVTLLKPGYKADGSELVFTEGSITNPYFVIDKISEGDTKHRWLNSLSIRADIALGLFVQAKVMQDWYFYRDKTYTPAGMNWQPAGGEIEQRWREYQETNYELRAGYQTNLSKDIHINCMLGGNIQKNRTERQEIYGTPFVIDGIYTINNTVTKTPTSSLSESQTNSIFGMLELSYQKWFYLTLTGREDWFSTLPVTNNHLFYPSISSSIVLSDLIKTPQWLPFAQIRASFAQVSGGAEPYSLDLSYSLDDKNYNNQILQGIGNSTIPNKQLKPLISSEFEIGTNLHFFNNRISFDLTYYKKKIKDDIVSVNIPNSSGFSEAILNTGRINNSGIELVAEVIPIQKSLTWTSTLTFSKNYNKVIDLGKINSLEIGASKNSGVTINIEKDQPYGVIKGTIFKRDNNGNIVYDEQGFPVAGDKATVLGCGFHDKILGFSNRFDYKNLSFRFLIDGKFGGKIYSQTNTTAVKAGKHQMTLNGREEGIIGQGVTKEGNINQVWVSPQDLASYYSNLADIAEAFIYDASFLKLREASLTYRLPKSIFHNTPLSNVSISLVARNLCYLLNHLENVGPESNSTSGNAQGIENNGYPETRSFGLNINLTF